jgi:AraC family transcriptional regulator
MNRVTDYIYDHLDDDIDLNKLADIAHLSPYHWHRIYTAIRGETIANTVKRLRLHRAAGYLAQTSMRVDDIAKKSGYANPQSFNRIFKSVYGMPPAQYRRTGSHTQFPPLNPKQGASKMYDIKIENLAGVQASSIQHTGSYMQIGKAFDQLMSWLGARNLLNDDIRMFGIFCDDVE